MDLTGIAGWSWKVSLPGSSARIVLVRLIACLSAERRGNRRFPSLNSDDALILMFLVRIGVQIERPGRIT